MFLSLTSPGGSCGTQVGGQESVHAEDAPPWHPRQSMWRALRLHRWHHPCFCFMRFICCASILPLLAFSGHPEKFLKPGLGLIFFWNTATLIICIKLWVFFLKVMPNTEPLTLLGFALKSLDLLREHLHFLHRHIYSKPQRNATACKHVCFLYHRSRKSQRFCSGISTVLIQYRKSLTNTSWPRSSTSPVRSLARKVLLYQQNCIQANGALETELWSLWQTLHPLVNWIRVNEVVIL